MNQRHISKRESNHNCSMVKCDSNRCGYFLRKLITYLHSGHFCKLLLCKRKALYQLKKISIYTSLLLLTKALIRHGINLLPCFSLLMETVVQTTEISFNFIYEQQSRTPEIKCVIPSDLVITTSPGLSKLCRCIAG